MKDIENRADLELLMHAFYSALLQDPSVNYIFTDVAKINLIEHLPLITDFWEQLLFNTTKYKNNVFEIHKNLHIRSRLEAAHFSAWLNHLNRTVDFHFSGEKAEKIKTSALSIATIMQLKLQ
jgi:hemoglobin